MVEILAILNFGGFMERSEFWWGGVVKNQYMGVELLKRGGTWTVCRFKRGALQERVCVCGGGGVLRGIENPMDTMLMESLLINRNHPPLNKNKQSVPLELFDS